MKLITILSSLIVCGSLVLTGQGLKRPNIILVMSDDQGWGQTGYNNHPVLKTPNLDKMAENGLRFNRFYAGAPLCSPTRASVLTGRSNDRTGVNTVGYPLCKQEKTSAQALKKLVIKPPILVNGILMESLVPEPQFLKVMKEIRDSLVLIPGCRFQIFSTLTQS